MKKFRLFIAICLCLMAVLCMTACTSDLKEPEGFKLDIATQTLSWNKVAGAKSYTIEINGQQVTTKANSYSLANLEAGIYDVKVKANGDGKETDDSKWAVYEGFERESETGLLYKLINNKTEYELVGIGSANGDVVMEDVFRGKPVTSIADNALRNNRLNSFTIGKNVKTIGKNAFQNSQNLVELVIPENVTSVGEGLVQGSKKLESVTLPESILEMPQNLASNCISLTSFHVGSKLTTIGANAFSYCSKLESVVLPDSVKIIYNNAFFRCENLRSADLGGILYVGQNAFSQCTNLAELNLGDALDTVDANAFYGCEALTSLTLPDTVKSIGERAFFGMIQLEDIKLGSNIESIGAYAFYSTKFFLDAPDGADTPDGGVVVLDGWVVGCKNANIVTFVNEDVVGVADYAFAGAQTLNTVDLPAAKHIGGLAFAQCPALINAIFGDGLLTIGASAFRASKALVNVKFGNSLTSIGDYAFTECKALAGLSIPETVDRIGTYAFYGTSIPSAADGIMYIGNAENPNLWIVGSDTMVNNPVIKDGTKGIASYAFVDCMLICDITLPDSLEYIGRGAFYGCGNMFMMSINIPASLREIDDYAFYDCPLLSLRAEDGSPLHSFSGAANMERIGRSAFYASYLVGANGTEDTEQGTVVVPGRLDLTGVDEIDAYAFFNSVGIETLYIGNGVQKIGDRAFANSVSIKSVTITNTLTEMGIRVFYKCAALETAIIGNGMKEVPDYTFYDCTALTSVVFVENGGVEHIGKYAFRGCTSLLKINFGDSLKSIDDYAFLYCAFTELVIPNTVETIGNYAFRGCKTIDSVVIPNTLVNLGKHAFYGLEKATIYCEAEGIPAYWNERWNTSYRPAVWGCTLSEDDQYVVSVTITADSIGNPYGLNGVSAPVRDGYTFAGWATAPESTEVAYAAADLVQVPEGTTLYAIWTPVQ